MRLEGSAARVEVEDRGIGIAPEFLPHLFERFRQAHSGDARAHGGLGLGLSIVVHIVELHGGKITVKSDGVGQGACFIVELPLASEAVAVTTERRGTTGRFAALRGEPVDLKDVRVLFVDDDEDTRELIGQLLRDAGAEVTVAGSVAAGMEVLEKLPVDVVVSDLSMPQEDGFSFARKIVAWSAKSGVTVPAIALSAFGGVEDRERALEAGFETHIAKPVEPSRLLSLISALAPKH